MRAKKLLSMLLVLVMLLSLFPMNAFALGGGRDIGIGSGFGRDIGDDEVREFDPTDYEEEGEDPVDYFQGLDEESGIQVTVESPFNALPTKAEVRLQPVDPESVREAVESVVDGEANVLVAMDISFWIDGVEIEPDQPVKVKISAPELQGKQNLQVVHIPDGEEAQPETVEMIGDEDLSFALGANEVAFKADSFSIYAIVDGDNPGTTQQPRVTYHFLSELKDDGSADPFVFLNKAGEQVDYQIVKDDELLEDPGEPVVGLEKNFLGWFIVDKDGDTYSFPEISVPIDFEEQPPVKATVTTGDLDVYVAPRYGQAFIVTFWDNAKGSPADQMHIVAKRVVYLDEGNTTTSVRVNDLTVPSTATSVLSGWKSDDYKTGVETEYTLIQKPVWDEVTKNFNLYPVFSEGHWLRFSGGPAGSGAGYNPAIFVTANTTTAELANLGTVTREGFTFAGWYYDSYTGTQPASDASGAPLDAADLLSRVQNATEDVTLYANWTGNQVSYRVVTWYQDAADDEDGNSTYSFGGVSDRTGAAGTTTNVAAAAVEYYTAQPVEQKEIKGDGTTVVNVYYNRTVYKLTFQAPPLATPNSGNNYVSQNVYVYDENDGTTLNYTTLYSRNGKWYTRSGLIVHTYTEYTAGVYSSNTYSDVKTIEARWGADISGEFAIVGNNGITYDHGERWKPQSNSVGLNKVLLKLMTMPKGNVTFQLSYPPRPLKTMNYYVQVLPNETGEAAPTTLYLGTDTVAHSNALRFKLDFTLNARYNCVTSEDLLALEGFKLLGLNEKADSDGDYIWDTVNDGSIDLYYTREQYLIHFDTQKPAATAPSDITGIYYQANIANTKAADIAALNQQYVVNQTRIEVLNEGTYVFQGWYENAACLGKPFDFNTAMPAGNIQLFAKWERVYYLIQIDPNGGEILPGVDEVTYTWLQYGDKIERYNIWRSYVEAPADYSGQKYYYYELLASEDEHRHDEKGYYWSGLRKGFYIREDLLNDKQAFMADEKYESFREYADSNWEMIQAHTDRTTAYMPATTNDNYAFVGWYKANITSGTDKLIYTNEVYDFDADVVGDTAIYAKWRRSGLFHVQYHSQNGTVSGNINGKGLIETEFNYADQANTKIAYRPDKITSTDSEGKRYVFVGWKLAEPAGFDANNPGAATLVGDVMKQGDTFTVDANYADSGHYIHLVAVYESADTSPETLPVTTVTFNPNFPTTIGTNGVEKKIEGVPLNTAIDLSKDSFTITLAGQEDREETIPEFSCAGYVQIGWNTDENAAKAGTVKFKMNDTVGVDNAEPAANILYAVWELQCFYVYHSSNNAVEKVGMNGENWNGENGTYNLVALTAENTLYGGYYSDYAGKSAGFDATAAAALTYTDGFAQDTGAIPYTLTNKNATWDWANGYSESGMAMKPTANAIYYLKEVPAKKVDQSYLHVSYMTGYDQIVNMWTVSNIDDANYSGVGFVILNGTDVQLLPAEVAEIKDVAYGGTAAKSLTLTSKNDPKNVKTLTAKDQFNADYGFITYRKVMFWDTTANNYTSELKDNNIVGAYWITKDQVLVVGNSGRYYTGLTTTIDQVQYHDVTDFGGVYDFTGMSVAHAYVDRNKG